MPMFTMNTNVPENKIPDNFLTDISALLAHLLGKPEMVGKYDKYYTEMNNVNSWVARSLIKVPFHYNCRSSV